MGFIKDHMVTDPVLQARIIARVRAARLPDQPDRAVHDLGHIGLPDGTSRRLFARHAADAVMLDRFGNVVLITRLHHPGAGKLALPGGFIDDIDGLVENGLAAALREAVEETGVPAARLASCENFAIGPRRFDRPFDIRAAWNHLPGTNIAPGDLFTVSTRGFGFILPGSLRALALTAGDDAKAVRVSATAGLAAALFAVPDHLLMIREAEAVLQNRRPDYTAGN
jgi:ADP-ribose pyrophosphatase YjhB (NUDIX family)